MAEDLGEPQRVGDSEQSHESPSSQNSSSGQSRKRILVALGAVLLVLIASVTAVAVINHRADVAAAERRAAAEARAAEEARLAEEAAAAKFEEAEAHHDLCSDQLRGLVNSLQKVDARLNVGLSQSALSDLVGAASVAYSKIDVDELGTGTCLSAAAHLETAFNAYAGTVSKWNDCIFDYGCDTDAITPSLQNKWRKASKQIDRATSLIDTLDPNSSDYDEGTEAEWS